MILPVLNMEWLWEFNVLIFVKRVGLWLDVCWLKWINVLKNCGTTSGIAHLRKGRFNPSKMTQKAGQLVTWSWLCTCVWGPLNASEPIMLVQKHMVSWTSVGKVPLWPSGVMEFLRLFSHCCPIPLYRETFQPVVAPLFWASQASPLRLATWKPISFQRHPYSNFRQPWLLPTPPFVTIYLAHREWAFCSPFARLCLPEQITGTLM